MGVYFRWVLIRRWAVNQINTVSALMILHFSFVLGNMFVMHKWRELNVILLSCAVVNFLIADTFRTTS